MQLLVFLVYAFINTFGITQPTPAGARQAARILGWVLLGVAVVAAAAVVAVRNTLMVR